MCYAETHRYVLVESILPSPFTMIPSSLEITVTTHHSSPTTCRVRKNFTVHDPFLDTICRIGYCCSKYFKFVRLTRVDACTTYWILAFIFCAEMYIIDINNYRKRRNFRWGLIFVGKQHPRKLNPRKTYTHKEFIDSNYGGLLSATKIYLLEI